MNSIGIHHVPVAQKNIVKPFKNGINSCRKGNASALDIILVPAKVVIETAPIFIQYGGEKSDGEKLKNVYR